MASTVGVKTVSVNGVPVPQLQKRGTSSSDIGSSDIKEDNKIASGTAEVVDGTGPDGKTALGLKRTLKPRHLTFVAIGGTIGT